MSWGKIDDTLHAHEKPMAAGLEAMGLWVTCLSRACAVDAPDGFTPRAYVVRACGSAKKADALANRLVKSRLWIPTEGGWTFHDWADYQLTQAQREALSAKRAEAGRLGAAVTNSRKAAKLRDTGPASVAASVLESAEAKVVYSPSPPVPSQDLPLFVSSSLPQPPQDHDDGSYGVSLSRNVNGDGAHGMALGKLVETVNQIRKGALAKPRGNQLAQVNETIRRGSAAAGESPEDWAARVGAAWAHDGGALGWLKFLDFAASTPTASAPRLRALRGPVQVSPDALTGEAAAAQFRRLHATLTGAGRLPKAAS